MAEMFTFAGFLAVIACVITWMATSVNVTSETSQRWRIEAVGHGYAHFNPDRSWHWNNEGASK